MQHLNNDMDNLVRAAAAAYDVPPTGADWQKVATQLDTVEKVENDSAAWAHSRRCGLLLLFLLASLVCNRYLYMPFQSYGSRLRTSHVVTDKSEKEAFIESNIWREKFSEKQVVNPYKEVASMKTGQPENVLKSFYPTGQPTNAKSHFETSAMALQAAASFTPTRAASVTKKGTITIADIATERTLAIPFVTAAPFINKEAMAVKGDENGEKKKRRFYLGAVAGPDISTVKFEKRGETGFAAGLVAGYQVHAKWAVETGLLWNRKNYYSSGKYFKTDKLNLPSHTKVIYAEGYCQMFEIPLNFRYRFGAEKKNNWFAAAGASSYLMQKEKYQYQYERYNVSYYGSKSYKAASRNWLSVAQVSAGYEMEKASGLRIRIEPYLKVPLRGLGVGSLPVTSAGIQVGITYPVY